MFGESGDETERGTLILPEDWQGVDALERIRSEFRWLPSIKNVPNNIRREECQRQDAAYLGSVQSGRIGQFGDLSCFPANQLVGKVSCLSQQPDQI